MKAAILHAETTVYRVVKKSYFWQRHREVSMNERQVKVINRLWDGFEGKLTTSNLHSRQLPNELNINC